MVEVRKTMVTPFKMSRAHTSAFSAPSPAAGHRQPMPLPETPGHSWGSLGQSLVGPLLLSPGSWRTQGCVCALQESVSPVLCKFWWLYGGVNGDLLQEGLCHTQVCCTQTPAPVQATLSHTPQETPKHSPGSVSVGSLGPGVHKVCLSPPSVSGGYRV